MTNNKGLKGQQDRQVYVYMDTGKPGTGLKQERSERAVRR